MASGFTFTVEHNHQAESRSLQTSPPASTHTFTVVQHNQQTESRSLQTSPLASTHTFTVQHNQQTESRSLQTSPPEVETDEGFEIVTNQQIYSNQQTGSRSLQTSPPTSTHTFTVVQRNQQTESRTLQTSLPGVETEGKNRKCCDNIIINILRVICTCAIKKANVKFSNKLINSIFDEAVNNDFRGRLLIINDLALLIYFLVRFIYSVVEFGVKQEPLGYYIVCTTISLIAFIVGSCKLVHSFYTHYKNVKQRVCQVVPQGNTEMHVEDIESESLEERSLNKELLEEALQTGPMKKLAIKLVQESFIYPSIICSLFRLTNEKSWQFDDGFAALDTVVFLYSLAMDAFYTKFHYIWLVQKVIRSLYHNAKENWKRKLKKCWLPSLLVTSHVFLLALIHWIMLAIIGVRIYVDNFSREISQRNVSETGGYQVASYIHNFSREIDQGNISDTGSYRVAPYTRYMIFCGAYLPVASVIVYIILNRIWLSDEKTSKVGKTFYFLIDPVAYIVVPFLMVPFFAFFVGIFLPDYDSSEFEVDSNARNTAGVLGMALFIMFLFCNIRATVILIITLTVLPIILAIILIILGVILAVILAIIAIIVAVILAIILITVAYGGVCGIVSGVVFCLCNDGNKDG